MLVSIDSVVVYCLLLRLISLSNRPINKGCNPIHLLQLRRFERPVMLQVKFPVVDIIQLISNRFAMCMKIKTTGESKLVMLALPSDLPYKTSLCWIWLLRKLWSNETPLLPVI